MRVVMISDQYPPIVGGTERQAEKLSRAMVERGHRVLVLTGRWSRRMPSNEENEGIQVRRLQTAFSMFGIRGLRKYGQDVFARSLKRELQKVAPESDIFHVHFVRRAAAVALEVGSSAGVPVLVKETSSGTNNSFHTLQRDYKGAYLQRYFLKHLRHVAVLNRFAEAEYTALPFEKLQIHRTFNGIDVRELPEWSPDKKGKRILFLGRIRSVKGALTLFEAFAQIHKQLPGWTLRFCGEGEGMATLEKRVREERMSAQCEIAGVTERPLEEMANAALLVLPSQAEGMSNTLLEAMAIGVPSVATAVGANEEMLADDCGWVVPELDTSMLAKGILAAAASEEERRRRGLRARKRVRARYKIEDAARHYEEVYQAICSVPSCGSEEGS